MFDWLLRRLPKRVLQLNGVYYPQVWFLWWHYVWKEYYDLFIQVVFQALDDAISTSKLDPDTKERFEEFLRVDDIWTYPEPYVDSREDTASNIHIICPPNTSLPEVDWLRQQVDPLSTGKYRQCSTEFSITELGI